MQRGPTELNQTKPDSIIFIVTRERGNTTEGLCANMWAGRSVVRSNMMRMRLRGDKMIAEEGETDVTLRYRQYLHQDEKWRVVGFEGQPCPNIL